MRSSVGVYSTAIAFLAALLGCGSEVEDERVARLSSETFQLESDLNATLRAVAARQGLTPYPGNRSLRGLEATAEATLRKRADLGRFLFFDHILSGVRQTSCATCHHAAFQFADGRNIARGVFCSMSADSSRIVCEVAPREGTAGNVVGPQRTAPLNSRNTPSVINSALFPKQMWNGRFAFVDQRSTDVSELDPTLGFSFPPPETLLLTRSLLTAQAHIPVTEAVEMTGDFPYFGQPFPPRSTLNDEIRTALARLVSAIPAYRALFEDAYARGTSVTRFDPIIRAGDPIPYLAIADAMATFEERDLVMTSAPWDHFLAGDDGAMSTAAKRGALIFLGRGKCSSCHSGDLFSDFRNHNIGVPVVGPGTGFGDPTDANYLGLTSWDFGAEEVTGDRRDRFKHRTPPLRGVALTSPYMHNGCYARLEDAILHHARPRDSYAAYDISQIERDMQAAGGLKPLQPVFDHKLNPVVIGPGTAIVPDISDADIPMIIEFLKSLTDPRMNDTSALAPAVLPSGLPADIAGRRSFPLYR